MSKVLGIIPARIGSTRLKNKPLVDISGKTLIQRTYESCKKSTLLDELVVATDSQEIIKHVTSFGGKALMTNPNHNSGTQRCIEIAERNISNFDIFINIQGDHPILDIEHIDPLVIKLLNNNSERLIATPIYKISDKEDIFLDSAVKVVVDKDFNAMYFSRSPIPFVRDLSKDKWHNELFYKHIGIYGFTKSAIISIKQLKTSNIERLESLEQLTWLYNGMKISCMEVKKDVLAVDTAADVERVKDFLNESKS